MRVVAVLMIVAGCQFTGSFVCDVDEECRRASAVGRCFAGSCAFTDTTCASGFRFDTTADSKLADQCAECNLTSRWYADADGDGHGDPSSVVVQCTQVPGTSPLDDDCNDDDGSIHPGTTEICDGVDNDCDSATADPCPSGCTATRRPPPDDAHLYMFCSSALLWSAASTACANDGYQLVRIDDSSENDWVRDQRNALVGVNSVHIGANDRMFNGLWVWQDGTAFWSGDAAGAPIGGRYENWDSGEPNAGASEDCGEMLGDGTWNDEDCPSTNQGYVCEK